MYAPSPQQVHIRIWRNCDIIAWGGGSPLITLENIRTDDDDVEDGRQVQDAIKVLHLWCQKEGSQCQ